MGQHTPHGISRIVIFILVVSFAFLGTGNSALVLAILLASAYGLFAELIATGILVDILYGHPELVFFMQYRATLLALIACFILWALRKSIRIHDESF